MVSLALTEHFKQSLPDYTHLILVICSSSFILFHAIGFNVIPMLLVGELCPVRLKSWTSGITISVVAILVFTVVKVFPLAMAAFGASAVTKMQKHAKSCKNLQNHPVLMQNLAKPCKIMQKQLSLM